MSFPPQHQDVRPGIESKMNPLPVFDNTSRQGCGRLKGRTAIITGGDSGIGRSVAVQFAKEGANVAVVYLNETDDANTTLRAVEHYGTSCVLLMGDAGQEKFCQEAVQATVERFGGVDILVNNCAEQSPQTGIENITEAQLLRTFQTNIFSCFYMAKAVLPHMKQGASIINTASITAYKGSPQLLDYSSTKGAVVSFTRSLSQSLVEKGIRVNAVAPGPIWTPLIPSTFPADQVAKFGDDSPMKRAGQPIEVAACYVFLASEDAAYMTGQVLHPNGGEVING